MKLVTTARGIGRLVEDWVEIVDVPFADIGDALRAGATISDLGDARVAQELSLSDCDVRPPLLRPTTVWAVGWAYQEHRDESDTDQSATGPPFLFLKSPGSVVAHNAPIVLPDVAPDFVDYEGELAVVISQRARAIDVEEAQQVIAGYTIANDVSARDIQKGLRPGTEPNLSLAKSFDTFLPMGPSMATPDEAIDIATRVLITRVDGAVVQRAPISDMIFSVPEVVSYLAAHTTLHPGDVLLTGTPAGVGYARGRFLRAGSTVEVEITGLGTLSNHVVGPTEGEVDG